MKKHMYIAYGFIALAPMLALVPLVRVAVDWVAMSRVVPSVYFEAAERGYDWVTWAEHDGVIRADYVFHRGPAAEAGLRRGDVFQQLNYQPFFTVEDLQQAVEGIPAGRIGVYSVMRDESVVPVEVQFSRSPTFLYPLSATLWQFSIWGFAIGAFLHIMGLGIIAPLAARSRKARFPLVLIFVSSLWIVGNLLRLLLVEIAGPPSISNSAYDVIFRALTFLGLAGWLAFPALLLHKVLLDARLMRRTRLKLQAVVLYLPAAILALAALVATLGVQLGPLTLNALAGPILFYACTYIAAAAALMFIVYLLRPEHAEDVLGRWSRVGSLITLILSVSAALAVLGLVSVLPSLKEGAVGWLIVSAQLLSVAPVVLVSHATLQHGKIDLVFSRGLVYLTLLGLIFFAYVGGMSVLHPYIEQSGSPRNIVAGFFVVALLVIFVRLAQSAEGYASNLLTSERRHMRRTISAFAEQIRSFVHPEVLARESAQALARAFGARFAAVFLRPYEDEGPFVSGAYHPEPPFVTQRFVSLVWPHLETGTSVWARNGELGEMELPSEIAALLRARSVALAIPVAASDRLIGLILLGEKRRRRTVYNLEDVDYLRTFSNQLALTVERLALVEREKALVRESAEAHLVALRAQINPHFLFNALNTIASLISERPEEAEETVERVASIFRHTLKAGSRAFVSLRDEIDLVSQYLLIEKARFGESLDVNIQIDEDLDRHPVPAFAIQTLVENAVKHGVQKRRGGGRVSITVRRADTLIEIAVSDSGVGIPALFTDAGDQETHSFYGVGLRNVAARLKMLYERADLLSITSDPDRGTTAIMRLPSTHGLGTSVHPVDDTAEMITR